MKNPAFPVSKMIPYHCPTCGGELFIDKSAPRSGTPCPLCREPLWFLQRSSDDGLVLTFLAGSRRAAGTGFSGAVLLNLHTAPSLVVDLSRLRTLPSASLDELKALRQAVDSNGGRLKLCGAHPQVAEVLEKAGLGTLVESLVNQAVVRSARVLPSSSLEASGLLPALPLTSDPPVAEVTVPA